MSLPTLKIKVLVFSVSLISLILFYSNGAYCQNGQKYLVLSSGDGEGNISEAWHVSDSTLSKLPRYQPLTDEVPLRISEALKIGLNHLKVRYPNEHFATNRVSLEQFYHKDLPTLYSDRNWIYLLSFRYNIEGHVQMVPVLLNGNIVLSDNEKQ